MLYDSTKILLHVILRSLATPERVGCDDQIEWGGECLFEMHQMSRPLYMGYRTDGWHGKTPTLVPVHERAARAIPYVKSMVRAIRRKGWGHHKAVGLHAAIEFRDIAADNKVGGARPWGIPARQIVGALRSDAQ